MVQVVPELARVAAAVRIRNRALSVLPAVTKPSGVRHAVTPVVMTLTVKHAIAEAAAITAAPVRTVGLTLAVGVSVPAAAPRVHPFHGVLLHLAGAGRDRSLARRRARLR